MEETSDQVRVCADEIGSFLPELAERHSPLVVLAALSEHIGSALLLFQQTGRCTPAQARAVLEELERIAFANCADE